MKVEKAGIYVDAYELRKVLKSAQFLMTKAERIVYGTPVLSECAQFMSDFVMAYEFEEERTYYFKKMSASFEVMKSDLRIIAECHVLKGTSSDHAEMKADTMIVRIFELVGRIDDGISKWKRSALGKTIVG